MILHNKRPTTKIHYFTWLVMFVQSAHTEIDFKFELGGSQSKKIHLKFEVRGRKSPDNKVNIPFELLCSHTADVVACSFTTS